MTASFSTLFQNCINNFASSHSNWILERDVYETLMGDSPAFDKLADENELESISVKVDANNGGFLIELGTEDVSFFNEDFPEFCTALHHMESLRIRKDEMTIDDELTPVAVCIFKYSDLFRAV